MHNLFSHHRRLCGQACSNTVCHSMHSRQTCCMAGCVSACPTTAHFSICIFYITGQTLPLVFQAECQAVVIAALQQVGAALSLTVEEQQTLLAARVKSIEEHDDQYKYNKMLY